MNKKKLAVLWQAFLDFIAYAPSRQGYIFVLMLLQGLSAGIGLLLIIPMLHTVGLDIGDANSTRVIDIADTLFNTISLELQLEHVLFSYILLISTVATIRYQLSVQTTLVRQGYIGFLRMQLYRELLNTRWQFIVRNKMSDFMHSLSGQVQAIGHASQLMLNLINQAILCLIMITLAFLLSWKMSLLAILLASLIALLVLPLNKVVYGSGENQLLNFKVIFQILTEQLASLKMIKSYASEEYHASRLEDVSAKLESQQLKLSRMNATTQWIYMVSAVVSFSIFLYLSQTWLITPLPITVLLLLISARLLPQLASLQQTYQQLLHKVPAFHDIHDMRQHCAYAQEASINKHSAPHFHHCIRLSNITYRYPHKHQSVFKGLSFTIKKNDTVALVGPSGAGKSTLADIISGLLEADSGDIFFDEYKLDDKDKRAWRQNVAYVTQEVYLFHDTIRANLNWVALNTTDKEIWLALKMAAANDFVALLPEGLDTIIGDRGIRLSGGERQRLALARALLAKPQLLILDEATSALDSDNEHKIQQALKDLHGSLTIIIISHRETTLTHADQRIELDSIHNETTTASA